MKKVFTIVLTAIYLLGNSVSVKAQEMEFEDLFVIFLDEKYEKCIGKAESYTMKDKTKKEPLPYLYMGMAYFEMSKDQEYAEKYPKAFNNTIKYTVKYRLKDKPGKYFNEFRDYFTEFKFVLIEEAENYYESGVYRKAVTNYKNITKFHPEDPSAWLARSVAEYRNLDVSTAATSMKKFDELFATMEFYELKEEQTYLLKYGFMWYAEYLTDNGKVSKGKEFIDKGLQYYQEDNEYKMKYKEIQGK